MLNVLIRRRVIHLATAAFAVCGGDAIAVSGSWLAPVSGTWSTPSNWSSDPQSPSGTTSFATIAATGAPYSVFVAGVHTVGSINLNSLDATLDVLSSGQLSVANQSDLPGGTLIVRGQVKGGTFNVSGTSQISLLGGTLTDVFLASGLSVPGPTFGGSAGGNSRVGGLIDLRNHLALFETSELLPGTEIVFNNSTFANGATYSQPAGSIIGPSVVIRTGLGSGVVAGQNFPEAINRGLISAETAGRGIRLDQMRNEGTVRALTGSTLSFQASHNAGTILVTGAVFADQPTFQYSGGNSGTIIADNSNLSIGANAGTWTNTGTVLLQDSNLTIGFARVIAGNMQLSGNSSVTVLPSATVDFSTPTLPANLTLNGHSRTTFLNGVSMSGGTVSLVAVPGTFSQACELLLGNATLFGGTAEVQFDGVGDRSVIRAATGSTTIGPGVTVRTGAGGGTLGASGTSLVFQGTASAQTPAQTLSTSGTFSNSGFMRAINAATLALNGSWSNTGSMQIQNATLNLGGTFSAASVVNLTGTNAAILITGTSNGNFASPLKVDGAVGTWRLSGGTIMGSTASVNGGTLAVERGNVWFGNLAVPTVVLPGGSLSVFTTLTLQPTGSIQLLGAATATPPTTLTGFGGVLSGNGEIVFGGTTSNNAVTSNISSIGAGVTIRTGSSGGSISLIGTRNNFGTISAQTSGQTLRVASLIDNRGVSEARNGGTLSMIRPPNLVDGTLSHGSWLVFEGSKMLFDTGTILHNTATIRLDGANASFPPVESLLGNHGTVAIAGGKVFNTQSDLQNTARFEIGTASVLRINGLLSNTGTIVVDGAMIVDYATMSQLGAIATQVAAAYAGGQWNQPGIAISPQAAIGLGFAEASETAPGGVFAGQNVDDTAVLLWRTLLGDANLDRSVNIGDFAFLAANFNQPSGWSRGDFNYDGTTNISDFALLAANFNQTLPSELPRQSIPEPAAAGVAAMFSFALRRRRRA